MLKKIAPVALAAVLVGTLAGCPQTNEQGGGGGVNENQNTPAEQAAEQPTEHWGNNVTGDKRNLAEGFTRAAWVQANLAAGEWEQAGEDLNNIEEQIQDINNSEDVPAAVRSKVAALEPQVQQLGQQIVNHDRTALQSSRDLVDRFSNLLNDQATLAWMSEGAGGGAGTGTMDNDNRMNDNDMNPTNNDRNHDMNPMNNTDDTDTTNP